MAIQKQGSLKARMKRIVWQLALGGLILAGCAKSGSSTGGPRGMVMPGETPQAGAQLTPQQQLFEYLREGMTQITSAEESILEAQRAAVAFQKIAPASERDALKEILERINSAGAGISEHVLPAPSWQNFAADSVKYDKGRMAAIEAANDAVVDLRDARGIAADRADQAKGATKTALADLAKVIDVAADDTAEAIKALGSMPPPDAATEP